MMYKCVTFTVIFTKKNVWHKFFVKFVNYLFSSVYVHKFCYMFFTCFYELNKTVFEYISHTDLNNWSTL